MRRSMFLTVSWLSIGALAAAEAPPGPTAEWPRASLEQPGFDAARIEELVETLRKNREIRNVHSFLIARKGWLVL